MNRTERSQSNRSNAWLRQQIIIFVIMLLFGFIIMNHVQSVKAQSPTRDVVALYREREEELKKQEERYQKLLEENKTLNEKKAALMESLLVDQGREELSAELQKVRLLAGFTEIRGPGIILTLDDKPDFDILKDTEASIVHDGDIRHALDLLRNVGVAGLSVNDLRITNASYIKCIGSTIRCNQSRLLPPFVIKAIGDPDQLAQAILQDILFSMRQDPAIGLIVTVEKEEEVVLPPFAEADNFERYITLLEGK
ncbi:MAG: DUF881 domain-containing protein [Clostridia bacterium]|nr:DUF881 domain-containing protein [Clostridia bacterium]